MNEQKVIQGSKDHRKNDSLQPLGNRSFEDLKLRHDVMRALKDAGYATMFPIQEQGIPPLLEGKDIIGQAHTGSGKTAAFSIPMIEKLRDSPYVQGLVLVPTRELALQVSDEFNKLAKYSSLRAFAVYGGQSITPQIERLHKKTPQVVVATPGRLIDHIERQTIDLGDVSFVVLDEADRMLDMGFIDDIDYILRQLPEKNQMSLFSATMPEEIKRLSSRYMHHPTEILIDSDEISVESIEQKYVLVDERSKLSALIEYLRRNGISSGIVFCSMKFRAQRLADKLQAAGFKAAPIHGDLSQNQREHAMRNFRSGHIELLVATDVAARGIDVPAVSHVMNYDVPQDPLIYFHRIGRTARAGRAGQAVTFVTQGEYPDFNRIVGMTEVPIVKMTGLVGEGKEIHEFPSTPQNSFRHQRRYGGQNRRHGNSRNRGNSNRRNWHERSFDSSSRTEHRQRPQGGNFAFTESVGGEYSHRSTGDSRRDHRNFHNPA